MNKIGNRRGGDTSAFLENAIRALIETTPAGAADGQAKATQTDPRQALTDNALASRETGSFPAGTINAAGQADNAGIRLQPERDSDLPVPAASFNAAAQVSGATKCCRVGSSDEHVASAKDANNPITAPAAPVQQELTKEQIEKWYEAIEIVLGNSEPMPYLHEIVALAIRGLERPSEEAVNLARHYIYHVGNYSPSAFKGDLLELAREVLRWEGEKP